ncbi:MAG: hypothetical protein AB8B50_00425 [Pirellulaceae bacterium]
MSSFGIAAEPAKELDGLPLVFHEDFEQGAKRWELTDTKAWDLREVQVKGAKESNHVFGLNKRKSDYEPQVRSPHNIALIKELHLSEFIVMYRVRSTKDTGNHRDCCTFFCHQDAEHFYYVHLGARPDPHSGQIMIVNGTPRKAMTENEKLVPWDDEWHTVKLERSAKSGSIKIYFDNMEKPHMEVTDKTFTKGRIGIGSFDDMNDFDDIVVYGH